METVESLRSMKICRFCLTQGETVSSIYDKKIYSSSRNSIGLTVQILACISVEVFPSDGLPCHICERCRFFMDAFYHFKQMCRQADEQVLAHIEDGIEHLITPLVWPKKLTRIYNALAMVKKKSNKVKTVKTPSGATVQLQVTDADLQSDSEAEEEENTFKISIDGDYNEDPECIKVVKSSSNQLLKITNEQSFFNPIIAQGDDKKYNCTICNKVFGSHTYYTRHMQMRHKSLAVNHGSRGPYGEYELYRCDQCEDVFQSQDGLIYHSAKHATENLTCPLCQEKFQHVEEVSEHIKTHVDGAEFMCDLCELVFTTKEKLDQHLIDKHSEELQQEQELGLEDDSMEEEDDEDHIRIKEENGETVVEVTKNFVGSTPGADVTNSEESDAEISLPVSKLIPLPKVEPPSPVKADQNKPVSILKKREEMKKNSLQKQAAAAGKTATVQKQAKPAAVAKEASPSPAAATADKSLRLLEKELQELQRTNTNRAETSKPAAKNPEPQRPKRSHASTPKTRPQEEKKVTNATKTPAPEKKPERRSAAAAAATAAATAAPVAVTKENKEPKESKETKSAPKEDKVTEPETEKEEKPKETPSVKAGKNAKNNANDESLRRSSRSGKVKDYAKMIHERSSDESTDDDEEYTQTPTRTRKSAAASKGTSQAAQKDDEESPSAVAGSGGAAKKRGRPRKPAGKTDATPAKVMKAAEDEIKPSEEEDSEPIKSAQKESTTPKVIKKAPATPATPATPAKDDIAEDPPESPVKETTSAVNKSDVIKSPSGQTLKKVPIKALPPGVKPLPLHRPAQSGQVCEMQIGTKMVKVQKIVMTKAEVEAMTKKGLVEVKHGTMVLKQGIKLPTSDAATIKTTLMSEASKDSDEKSE